jgi:hypothetical protein
MHRLILDVNDNVLDKVFYFLNNLPKQDVKIIANETIEKDKNLDFISVLTEKPITVEKSIEFLSRDESNDRKQIKNHQSI